MAFAVAAMLSGVIAIGLLVGLLNLGERATRTSTRAAHGVAIPAAPDRGSTMRARGNRKQADPEFGARSLECNGSAGDRGCGRRAASPVMVEACLILCCAA